MPILRRWTARATHDGARAYVRYFDQTLSSALAQIPGHLGALVMTRDLDADGAVEIVVETSWTSHAAITAFAGPEPTRAVVEVEARPLLTDFDENVTHHEIRLDTARPQPPVGALARPIGLWLRLADDAITARFDAVLAAYGGSRREWQELNVAEQQGTLDERGHARLAALRPTVDGIRRELVAILGEDGYASLIAGLALLSERLGR